jgi:hypothetical protein
MKIIISLFDQLHFFVWNDWQIQLKYEILNGLWIIYWQIFVFKRLFLFIFIVIQEIKTYFDNEVL